MSAKSLPQGPIAFQAPTEGVQRDAEPRNPGKRYYPVYSIPETLSERDARRLRLCNGGGPLALGDVTDVCLGLSVTALLRDGSGYAVGTVDADGTYQVRS